MPPKVMTQQEVTATLAKSNASAGAGTGTAGAEDGQTRGRHRQARDHNHPARGLDGRCTAAASGRGVDLRQPSPRRCPRPPACFRWLG